MQPTKWNLFQKTTFLFFFTYVLLYASSTQYITTFLTDPIWKIVIPWFAEVVGHDTPITIFPNGSGDTTFNYYQVLFFGIVAACLAIPMVFFKRKINYSTLSATFVVIVRYYLAYQMLLYGLAKVYGSQFIFPTERILDQELGDISPMRLLWTFMGYSKVYSTFTGILECVAGLLLFNKRTTTLGALTTFGVMLNVMLLNYCYDVPLKLFSTHLVLMSVFLIALDGKRLLRFFVQNSNTTATHFPPILPPKYRAAKKYFKWIFIVGQLLYITYLMNVSLGKVEALLASPSLFQGKYTVESFERNRPVSEWVSSNPEALDWKSYYALEDNMVIETRSGSQLSYRFQVDTSQHLLRIKATSDHDFYDLDYAQKGENKVHISGIYKSDTLNIVLQKKDYSKRLLVSRGFHWVNEYPYNW